MIAFAFSKGLSKKQAAVLPLFSENLKKLSTASLKGLTTEQQTEVQNAVKGQVLPKSGFVPLFGAHGLILLHLLGEQKKATTRDIREAGEGIRAAAERYQYTDIGILPGALLQKLLAAYREGIVLGTYDYMEWKGTVYKEKTKTDKKLQKIAFVGLEPTGELKRIELLARSIAYTKDLVNCPPHIATPSYVEKLVREFAKELPKVHLTVIGEKELTKIGCNGIVAVGAGSHEDSRLLLLEYRGGKSEKPIALVGKGVTYDTGGLNLKPGRALSGMKQDLAGAAAVLGAFYALVSMGVKKNIVVVIPTVENTVNSFSYKPDDVIRMYNGVTVEITNTDAEGRLILADALAYAAEKYKPRAMIDLATLTGHCIYAVGPDFAAALSMDKKLMSAILASATRADEPMWELPFHQRYKKNLESPIADIVNSSDKFRAGVIEGALFLQHFVPEGTPWCHLDIASVAFDEGARVATGRTVRTLLEFVEKY